MKCFSAFFRTIWVRPKKIFSWFSLFSGEGLFLAFHRWISRFTHFSNFAFGAPFLQAALLISWLSVHPRVWLSHALFRGQLAIDTPLRCIVCSSHNGCIGKALSKIIVQKICDAFCVPFIEPVPDFFSMCTCRKIKKWCFHALRDRVHRDVFKLLPYGDAYDRSIKMNFIVSEFQEHWYGDKVVFEQKWEKSYLPSFLSLP